MSDTTAKFDMKIPAFALAGALLGGAGMFYGVQARVGVLEVRAQGIDEHTKAQSGKIEQLRTDAENSRTRMMQSVSEMKELLIELRANSRRLEDKIEALNKK